MTMDLCGRYWLSLEMPAVKIYDNQEQLLGYFTLINRVIIDTFISENYVAYFSDHQNDSNQTIHIDLHIEL